MALHPKEAKPLAETLQAIAEADLITLGPGSLFTSVLPNLLVKGIPKALAEARATKAFFLNLMSQPGETTELAASEHVRALQAHGGRYGRKLIDVCVVNTRPIAGKVLKAYTRQMARPVEVDRETLKDLGVEIVEADLLRMMGRSGETKIRHDSTTLGAVALELAQAAYRQLPG